MTEKLKQTIKEEMTYLPKESVEEINAFDWEDVSYKIAQKYFNKESDINVLQAEVAIALLGLSKLKFLAINIENHIVTTKEESEIIANEIVEKIIKPIYNKLCEKIKSTLDDKVIHWQQNLDFILSGGDYTAFIREPLKEQKKEVNTQIKTFNPSKIDDLKSSFTI